MESRGVVRCKDADLWPTNGQGRDFMRPRAKQTRMTRMHFEAIAATLKAAKPAYHDEDVCSADFDNCHAVSQWVRTVNAFTDMCIGANNLFRVDTFRRACGLEN